MRGIKQKTIWRKNFWNNYIEYENNGDSNKDLTTEEYLDKLKPYLKDIIIDLQNSDTRKIHLTIATSFISSKDVDEERLMHAKSDNVELMSYDNVNDINDKLFESLPSRYQGDSETSTERLRTNSSCFQNWNTVKSH